MAALRAVHAIYQDEKLIFADRGAIPENGSEVIVTFFINKSRPEDMMTTDPLMELRGRGEIIENYPADKPYPSCLVCGRAENGRPVHSVWAYNSEKRKAVLITVYEPDPKRWIDGKKRRKA